MRVPAQIVAHVEPALLVLKDAEGATPRNHDDFDAPRDRAALRLHGADVAAPRFGDGLRVTGRQRARMAGAMVGDSKRRDRREQDEPRDNGRCFHELECTGSRIPLPLSLPDRSSRAPVICPPVPGATGRLTPAKLMDRRHELPASITDRRVEPRRSELLLVRDENGGPNPQYG